jgi:hypothetical protein
VGVPSRLRYVQEFVWRGGTLRLVAHEDREVYYELRAEWETPVLDSIYVRTERLQSVVPLADPLLTMV